MAKKVAIIGAGISGLASIKAALEAGLDPTAYERDSWIGGIWYYTEDERFCVQKSTILNTSKHFSCFSDFPIPKDMPNYLPAQLYQRYLESYAKKFELTKRIRFSHSVVEIKKCEDFEMSGRWEVHYVGKTEPREVCVEVFDFVMVCVGVYTEPYLPDIPSIKDFAGEKLHSTKYKTFKGFEGKRVMVVGLGNSAGDIACELSRHASQVYLSTRRGSWILPRLTTGGRPVDVFGLCRSINSIPEKIVDWLFYMKLKSLYDLANFGLEPEDKPSVQVPVLVNDELPHRIVVGAVITKTEIDYFKEKQVFFKDGTHIKDIDTVIFATGFNVNYPFLPKSIFKPNCSHQFYKAVFPPELSKPTMAFIGGFRVRSSVLPISEMQARWTVHVFNGNFVLPSKEEMKRDILALQYHDRMEKFGKASNTQLLIKNYISYMDDVGSLTGVKPNLCKMFFQEPGLAVQCFFGPCIPAQYRLVGPHSWSGARKVIEDVEDSLLAPLRTRPLTHLHPKNNSGRFFIFILLTLFVALVGMFLYKNYL